MLPKLYRVLVTSFIGIVLACQVAAIFHIPWRWHSGYRPPYMWPIMDYPMYSRPHYAGDVYSYRFLVGVTTDGSKVQIEPAAFRVHWGHFGKVFLGPVSRPDPDAQNIQRIADFYKRHTGTSLRSLSLHVRPYTVTGESLVQGNELIEWTAEVAP